MPKNKKIPLTPEQIEKRESLRALLPERWRYTLMTKTGRSGKYLSKMLAGYQVLKPEWPLLLEMAHEQKAAKELREAATEEVLA